MSKNLNLQKMKAVLRTHHGGPGPHKDGSPQSVHGKKGAGSTSTSTTGKAGGKGSSKIKKTSKYPWRDPDGKMQLSDAYIVEQFGALPSSGMASVGIRGPGKGTVVYTDETLPSHAKSIHAFFPLSVTQDDFVRFYFSGDHLEFSVTTAGVADFDSGWQERAVDNIYDSLDRLSAAGVPSGTKVIIKGGSLIDREQTLLETTI